MANKLNLTGLAYFYNRIKTIFAAQDDLDALSDRVDEIVAEGGEPNVIETVKVNGAALTPDAQKAVDVTVPQDLSDLTNTGQDPYATEDYVDQNGGKIDKIKVNGTEQTITNKEVDITVPVDLSDLTNTGNDPYAQESDLPTDLSDLTNTAQDPYAKMSDVESRVVGALKPKGSVAFASLPALTAANLNNMYNVSDAFTTTADFIEGAGKAYPAGTNVAIINTGSDASPVYKYDAMPGVIDMSGYWSKSELVDITTAEIDTIIAGN